MKSLWLQNVIKAGETPIYLKGSPARKGSFERLYDAHLSTGSNRLALDVLNSGLDLFPDETEFYSKRAALLYDRLNRPADAAEDYLYLLEHGPRDHEFFSRWRQSAATTL